MFVKNFSKTILTVVFACSSVSLSSAALNPQAPVQITTDGSVEQSVTVAGNGTGFVAAWQNNLLQTAISFSSNEGLTWSPPVTLGTSVFGIVSVAAQNSRFVVSWSEHDDASNDSYVSASVSTSGLTWSAPTVIQMQPVANGIGYHTPVAATNAGFMLVWTERDLINGGHEAKTSFSADGMTWNSPVQINTMGTSPDQSKVSIAGNANGFLATFTLTISPAEGYAVFSSNNGATWSAPVSVSSVEGGTLLAVGANASGFLAAYVETSMQTIATRFSTDNGATWSSPVQIPMSHGDSSSLVSVSANNQLFVVTWVDASNNCQASISDNNGATWSAPISFPTTPSIYTGELLGVSVLPSSNAMFTWRDTMNNAYSSFAGVRSNASSSPQIFFNQISPNRPGKKLF